VVQLGTGTSWHHVSSASFCDLQQRLLGATLTLNVRSMVTFCLVAATGCWAGCHRAHYRNQANAEAYALIGDKAEMARSMELDYQIEIDARSRMFDPFNPDCEPMPPDDPAAQSLMRCVDDKRGFPHWWDNGRTPFVDNPQFMQFLPLNEDRRLDLDAATAVRLAGLHSPEYQSELEELFLSALDVSAERFRFDTQFYGGYETFFDSRGPDKVDGPTSLFRAGTRDIRIRKAFTTGAELVVGLANSMVWQFSGRDNLTAFTLLDFSFVQPLLRRAGRDRILETLTLAERTLLANVRQMERYRRGFQLDIVTGAGGQSGPSRRGGFFGGSGLTGFTGVGGSGFGGVGSSGQTGGGTSGGAAEAGGLLGLLQDQQNIRNLETNITSLRSSLAQLEAFRDAGRIDLFQVDQARQDLFLRQSELLNAKTDYQNSLDRLKIDLGLPPQLEVEIHDPTLDQFNLIDPAIIPLQNRVADLQQRTGQTIIDIIPIGEDMAEEATIVWDEQMPVRLQQLVTQLQQVEQLRKRMREENLSRALADIQRFQEALPDRRRDLGGLQDRLEEALRSTDDKSETQQDDLRLDPSMFNSQRLDNLPLGLRVELEKLVQGLVDEEQLAAQVVRDLQDLMLHGPELSETELLQELVDRVFVPVPMALTQFSDRILELSLIQARARTETVTLVAVKMDADTALDIARIYRRDWMNARTELVNAWRLIEFNADDLESDLDIVFGGDLTNVGDNPLRLRSTAGLLRVGLQWDGPFTRLLERNVYRESLIDYQRARRSYYRFEDSISASLRQTIRQIALNQVNFELRRAAVEVAVRQVQLARLRLQEPPKPGETQTFGPTTAQNLVEALSALRRAQDAFLSVWVNYEVQRRILDLNLGVMQIDSEGVWVDPGAIGLEYGYPRLDDLQRDAEQLCLPPIEPQHIEFLEPGVPQPLNFDAGQSESELGPIELPQPD
jgi:hypothetical protein